MVLSLLDAGWYPNSPAVWTDASLTTWLNEGEPADFRDCLEQLGKGALKGQWEKASCQHNGAGLEEGASVAALSASISHLKRRVKFELAASLSSIAKNAVWTHQRQ